MIKMEIPHNLELLLNNGLQIPPEFQESHHRLVSRNLVESLSLGKRKSSKIGSEYKKEYKWMKLYKIPKVSVSIRI